MNTKLATYGPTYYDTNVYLFTLIVAAYYI